MSWQSPYLNHDLSDSEVSQFINENDGLFEGKLRSVHNYSRVVSLAHFASLIELYGLQSQEHVGVVAGWIDELELKFLRPEKVSVLSRGDENNYDLDLDWSTYKSQEFSMTICNQVLEHVFNPHQAFKNLCHQTALNGYIYVSIPTINCIHGEPDFYSSGFHPRFLERLGINNGLEILNIGYWGSYKYVVNAVTGRWLAENRLKKGYFSRKDLRFLKEIFVDGRLKSDKNYIADSWALFKKVA